MAKDSQGILARFLRSPIRRIGLVALGVAVVFGFLGYRSLQDFLANASTELASIALTVLIIDYLNERRGEQQLKAQLIREMGGRDNGIALRAVEELRAHGWLTDGSLTGVYLIRANLEDADLASANLQKINLTNANLEKAVLGGADLERSCLYRANLREAFMGYANVRHADLYGANLQDTKFPSLTQVYRLRDATMQDGSRYDGRYNLEGDIESARMAGIDTNNIEAMANFYGVTLETYQRGQEWAKENLLRLRGEAAPREQAGQ